MHHSLCFQEVSMVIWS